MKQRTIVTAGVIALTGLTGQATAAPGASAPVLDSRAGRAAIVKAAITAVQKSVHLDASQRAGDKIPRRIWGEALQKLRLVRVVNDRMNVMIVLTEDSGNEKGLYVGNPISSYAVADTDPRFAAFELLSMPEDKAFGTLSRYHIRKKQTPKSPNQGSGRATKQR